ncbi:MAG: transcriptional activator NhaR [Pseudomonadota bacterium]
MSESVPADRPVRPRHLNYNHLLYFWTTAREGGIARAAEALHVTPQTISGQLKLLEDSIGAALFQRTGRRLVLTDLGKMAYQYADEIFNLGAELSQRVQSPDNPSALKLNVGVVNSIPKLIAYRILEPALEECENLHLTCNEGELEQLLARLAIHQLDLVISDNPIPSGLNIRAFNHKLGESSISLFGATALIRGLKKDFPASLDGAPMLLPTNISALRRKLEDWFRSERITPSIIAEFEDSALLKSFGQTGLGLFPAPTAIAAEVQQMYSVKTAGRITTVSETYFAITSERRINHPAVSIVTERARNQLLSD